MKVIGHRGAAGLAPENTAVSIQEALIYRVDEIEIDVRTTADGIAVLSHEAIIQGLAIQTSTYHDLKQSQPTLMTLNDAFAHIPRTMPVVLDCKPDGQVPAITKSVKKALQKGWKEKNITLASRDFTLLVQLHAELPALPTAVQERLFGLRASRKAHRLGTKRIHMPIRNLWRGYIAAVRRSGYVLYAYTVNDPGRAKKLEKYGLYGVFTDYPDRYTAK